MQYHNICKLNNKLKLKKGREKQSYFIPKIRWTRESPIKYKWNYWKIIHNLCKLNNKLKQIIIIKQKNYNSYPKLEEWDNHPINTKEILEK